MPTCQEWLDLIDQEGQAIDDLVAEKDQIDQQILAHSGILYSYVMQYQIQCMAAGQAVSESAVDMAAVTDAQKRELDSLVTYLRQIVKRRSKSQGQDM
jgi:hypothetical protein